MADSTAQSYRNHRKIVPAYHIGVFGIFVINFLYRLVVLVRWPAWVAALDVAVALALLLLFFYARIFALRVQDRVIRLEMRHRLKEILPADLRGRIDELTTGQLIGLRFAGDAEMPELVRDVLTEKLTDRDEIKRRVKKWEPDRLRC